MKNGIIYNGVFYKAVNCVLLIHTVSDDADGGPTDDTEGQNTKKALGVDAALILLDPDGSLELVGLLDEESCGTGVQADLVLYSNIFNVHIGIISCLFPELV